MTSNSMQDTMTSDLDKEQVQISPTLLNKKIIFMSEDIFHNQGAFRSNDEKYKKMLVTYDSKNIKSQFALVGKDSEESQIINKVHGIDGIGNKGALLSLLKQSKPVISKNSNGEAVIYLNKIADNQEINATASSKPSKDDLLTSMAGASLSDGWDIVVAYDLYVINNVLKTLYNDPQSTVIKDLALGSADQPFAMSYTPVNVPNVFQGLTYNMTISFDFKFSEPGIQFSAGTSNLAILDMPITSAEKVSLSFTLKLVSPQPTDTLTIKTNNAWYTQNADGSFTATTSDDVQKAIANKSDLSKFYILAQDPSLDGITDYQGRVYSLSSATAATSSSALGSGYALQANVPIASLTGTQTVTPANQVITFDESSSSEAHLVLDFNTESGSGTSYNFTHNGTAVDPDVVKEFPTILTQLANYFSSNVSAIDYKLTSLANTKVSNGGAALTPKSFRFNTQQVGSNACLAVFINTQESGSSPGGDDLNFETSSQQPFIPICSEASTTLIFSRGFISNYYLPKGLNANNFEGAKGTGTANSPVSVSATYKFKQSIPISVKLNLSFWESLASIYTSASADNVDFDGVPMSISFTDDNKITLGINVKEKTTLNLDWYEPGGPCMPGNSGTDHFPVTVTGSVVAAKAVRDLNWTVTEDGDISLYFEISKDDYALTIVASGVPSVCGSNSQTNIQNQIKSQLGSILPTTSVQLNTLKTVAETNLLFNGSQKVTLNTSDGVSSPLDIVTFGSIS